MSKDPFNLGKAELNSINTELRRLADLKEHLPRLEAGGVDTTQQRAVLEQTERDLTALKAALFPGSP